MQQLKRWPGIELRHLEALAVVVDEGASGGRLASSATRSRRSASRSRHSSARSGIPSWSGRRGADPSRSRRSAPAFGGCTTPSSRRWPLHAPTSPPPRRGRARRARGDAVLVPASLRGGRRHARPASRVVVEVVSAVEDDRLLRLLETGAVDLAIVRSASVSPPVRCGRRRCARTRLRFRRPLARAGQKRIALSDLGGLARIATADGTAFADDVAAPVVASDAEMALGLVGAGAGAAVLPALFASVAHSG